MSKVKTTRPKWPGGRPPKLNDELIKTICSAIRMGAYIETAVIYAGINKETFHDWIRKGKEKPRSKYGMFSDSIMKASAESELRGIADIDRASKGERSVDKDGNPGEWVLKPDWKATAWRLERQKPKHWSPKSTVKVEDDNTPKDQSSFKEENIHKLMCDFINTNPEDEEE